MAGLVVMAGALFGVLVVLVAMLSAASVPNSLEGTTFCCSSPDAWKEVPANVGVAMGVVSVDAALWVVASWLFEAKVRWRRLRLIVGGTVALALLVVAGFLVANADEAVVSPNCDRYEFDRRAFLSGDRNDRRAESVGLADCGVLRGRTRTQVVQLLGEPDGNGSKTKSATWRYGQLSIAFNANRVMFAEMDADPGFEMS